VETHYSRVLEISGLRYKYDWCQGAPWTKTPILKKEGIKLFQDMQDDYCANWKEICFYHFRHSKIWPL